MMLLFHISTLLYSPNNITVNFFSKFIKTIQFKYEIIIEEVRRIDKDVKTFCNFI